MGIGENMTREEIMNIANQAGLIGKPIYIEGLESFAKKIAEHERLACVDLLMGLHKAQSNNGNHNYYHFAANAVKELRVKL